MAHRKLRWRIGAYYDLCNPLVEGLLVHALSLGATSLKGAHHGLPSKVGFPLIDE